MSRTITDSYGDEITLENDGSGGLEVECDATEYEFTAQRAEELADAIYEELGTGNTSVVMASDLTFNEAALRLAALHGKKVRFRYEKGDLSYIETREFKPDTVATNSDGEVYFQGYDPDRDETRNYRLDRIKGDVEVVG